MANTVGHYDAYRKNVKLKDRFVFELISPLKCEKKIKIFKEDANILAKKLAQEFQKNGKKIDLVFLDPPYNSRQYSRFYHLLESLAKNDKQVLTGIARKRGAENMSEYCRVGAREALDDLLFHLASFSKNIVMTYNNTYNANARSNGRISFDDILYLMQKYGTINMQEINFKAFNSGKTDFKEHKERIFICQVR